MLPGAPERLIEVPEGHPGSWATLAYMARVALAPNPRLDAVAAAWGNAPPSVLFEWVRAHMLYTPDYNNGSIIEEIQTPGHTLDEIARLGRAIGDCDDYVVLLASLYVRRGHRVVLVAISRHVDQLLDHVFLTVDGIAADGIVAEPFGWEVPTSEVTYRMEYPL